MQTAELRNYSHFAATQSAADEQKVAHFVVAHATAGSLLFVWGLAETYQVVFHPAFEASVSAFECVALQAIEFKFLLGAWLLLGFRPRASLVAIICLLLGIGLSCAGHWVGHFSFCEWTTALPFGPWQSFVGVALILVSLVVFPVANCCLPLLRFAAVLRHSRRFVGSFALTMALLMGATAFTGYLTFGSTAVAFAYIRGEPFSLSPAIAVVHELSPGKPQVVRFTLTNFGPRPLRVVGGVSSCSCCNATIDLPLTVAPATSADLGVEVFLCDAPRSTNDMRFEQAIMFLTDNPRKPTGYVKLVGHLVR